jgi:hypothetical protein
MSSGVTIGYAHLKISHYRVFTLYVTLPSIQCIFYTVLTNSEVLVMIGHLTIHVFWDVMMCGRFRSAAIQHRTLRVASTKLQLTPQMLYLQSVSGEAVPAL